MKLLNLFGDTIEISNLESIIKDSEGYIYIRRSPKTACEKFEYKKKAKNISIPELTKLIFEAESKYNNYLIIVNEDYKYTIEGTNL